MSNVTTEGVRLGKPPPKAGFMDSFTTYLENMSKEQKDDLGTEIGFLIGYIIMIKKLRKRGATKLQAYVITNSLLTASRLVYEIKLIRKAYVKRNR